MHHIGFLLREGLVDREIVFNSAGSLCTVIWGRYKSIIDYYRRNELGPKWLDNYEYLAKEMWEMAKANGMTSPGFILDRYKDVFEPGLKSP